jgi:hypothetical protein
MTLTSYLFTREVIGGGQVTGVGVMDDRGNLWIDDARGLHPYPTGKLWQLSPIPEDSTLVAPLLHMLTDRFRREEESRAIAEATRETVRQAEQHAAEQASPAILARRDAITAGDHIMVSGTTLARVVSRDGQRMRIVRYTPHLDRWGKEQTLAKSWAWRVPTPEEIIDRLNYRALAEGHSRDETRAYRLTEKAKLNTTAARGEGRRAAHAGPMAREGIPGAQGGNAPMEGAV